MRPIRIKRSLLWISLVLLLFLCYGILSHWKKKREEILIAVVEEHHEVLDYWFEAVDEGTLPKGGVHLIHIDGHSDEAAPEYNPHAPFFDFPTTLDQLNAMMQKNDIFVQMSAMVGLMDRFLWIYPSWLDTDESYTKSRIDLGYFKALVKGTRKPVFCMCSTYVDTDETECEYENHDNLTKGQDPAVPIPPKRCAIVTNYTSERINELLLLEGGYVKQNRILSTETRNEPVRSRTDYGGLYFSSREYIHQNLVRENVPIIWDIDLDYFGCEMPGQILVDAGFTWRVVELIDSKLELLFCPQHIMHETEADVILKKLLHEIVILCQQGTFQKRCKLTLLELQKVTEKKVASFWKQNPGLFCARNDLQLRNAWKNIITIVHLLKFAQIEGLLEVGFCFTFSPKTFGATDIMAIQICHGANPPDTNFVQIYKTTFDDVKSRMERLEQILSLLPDPHIVTIARSSRDGYMPRKYLKYIELGVIEAIQKVKGKKKFRVWYDADLLGGEKGFGQRFKINLDEEKVTQ